MCAQAEMSPMEEVVVQPAPDDFGIIVRRKSDNIILGRCFVNPGGIFSSDFYGPGTSTPINLGDEKVEYWFYDRERKNWPNGFISHMYIPVSATMEQFKERFGISHELRKETHLDGKPTA